MKPYHKIVTVWERDPETKFKTLIEGAWSTPEIEALHDIPWEFTEKIDGTNIRVMWDGVGVNFAGRTDRSKIPPRLMDALISRFPPGLLFSIFQDSEVTLYGEGYGAKIQKAGGMYLPDSNDFILFDVFIGGMWLRRHDVDEIGKKIGCGSAPVLAVGGLREAIGMAAEGFKSTIASDFPAEGLVMRPQCGVLDRRGKRIISKIKCKDFPR